MLNAETLGSMVKRSLNTYGHDSLNVHCLQPRGSEFAGVAFASVRSDCAQLQQLRLSKETIGDQRDFQQAWMSATSLL